MFYFLYSLFHYQFPILRILKYITFRSAFSALTAFSIMLIFSPRLIRKLQALKIGENVRQKDCPDHMHKQGTPTMGGILIVLSVIVSTVLWADLSNKYILLCIFVCVWLGILGFMDDYLKLRYGHAGCFKKRTKLIFQIALGLILGLVVYFDKDLSTRLDVPFLKDFAINLGVFYILFVVVVIVGSSNAVNLTDGLDGLAIGSVLFVAIAYSALCYVTGHMKFSAYLFIPFIPKAGELTVLCSGLIGASLGFLWYNSYPASVFMGDVGSLTLGGLIGAVSVFIKKELLLVLVGIVFVVEAVSVILQVLSFRIRKKRIFKMAPLHHHFEKLGWHESKIIVRFWILGAIFALLTLVTLKLR